MRRKKTNEEYIQQLLDRKISLTPVELYVDARTKILHKCPKDHEWHITPDNVLRGTRCPKCCSTKRKTTEEYEQELLLKGILYVPIEEYTSSNTSILHLCPEGHKWKASPSNILRGRGCLKCSISNRTKNLQTYKEELEARNISYKVCENYISARTPILHSCSCGTVWNITPDNVLRGKGCPSCASYGFDPTRTAILYYIKVVSYHQEVYYKIGITNRTVEDRFSRDKDKTIQILMQKQFLLGSDARAEEQSILDKYKSHRITIPDFLKSKGNTELFEIDILGLDT